MREIKFRGKRIDNGELLYGDLLTQRNKASEDSAIVFFDGFMIPKSEAVIKETIGQYTGLKDKNGKEIYEGDVVRYEDMCTGERGSIYTKSFVGTVSWGRNELHGNYGYIITCNETTQFQRLEQIGFGRRKQLNNYTQKHNKNLNENCEVIGNIYENPELLEVDK
jgi:uncharacterized phage protein (TIGR01671 family)